jgi:hypothetical protein
VTAGKHSLVATVYAKNGLRTAALVSVDIQPAVPDFLVATITCASQNFPAATTELAFQVEAHDLAVGTKDGDGIDSVDLRIVDSNNQAVFKTTEKAAPYCAFGGQTNCDSFVFQSHGNRWSSNGPQIQNGVYPLIAIVHATNTGIPPVTLASKVTVQIR